MAFPVGLGRARPSPIPARPLIVFASGLYLLWRWLRLDFYLSNVFGTLFVLVGLWLVVSGAVKNPTADKGTAGFWDVILELVKHHPRIASGILLILIGATFLKVDFGPLLGS